MDDLFTSWDTASRMVIASIRTASFISYVSEELRRLQDDALCYREIAPGLFAIAVIDLPDEMLFVARSMLDDWGVSFDIVLETALNRLESASAEPFERLSDHVWSGPWQDGHTASRVLLPDVLRRADPSPYVAIPDRDVLIVGSGPYGFAEIVLMLMTMESRVHPVTRVMYQLVGDTLVPVKPPPTRIGAAYAVMLQSG